MANHPLNHEFVVLLAAEGIADPFPHPKAQFLSNRCRGCSSLWELERLVQLEYTRAPQHWAIGPFTQAEWQVLVDWSIEHQARRREARAGSCQIV